jgi:apolipoprotein N-acyltransferase
MNDSLHSATERTGAVGPGTWPLAIGGGLAMFLVQPPADLWPLAWLAPLPWLAIVQRPSLPGRRPWLAVWCGGLVFWLLAIHWLRLPHPATSIGWVLLSLYLACYPLGFVWAARRLVHRWKWPLVPAATVAWVACEHLRGDVLGGFTFAGLGHTQWRWTALIQLADAAGAVGVGGVVMAGAAGLAVGLGAAQGRLSLRSAAGNLLTAAAVVAATLGYGSWRLATAPQPAGQPLDVLLVQGSIDTELKHDRAAAAAVVGEYDTLTSEAIAAPDSPASPDLIVWPETMWRWPLIEIDPAETLPEPVLEDVLGPGAGGTPAGRQARARTLLEGQRFDVLAMYARQYATNWMVGVDRQRIISSATGRVDHYNAAILLDAAGRMRACYDKMYPVMFGEYLPLADRIPFLYKLTPLRAGLTAGTRPVVVEVAGYGLAPTICYETALPSAVRSIVLRLAAAGRRPDVIVNLTNDGWFWGSSELDMHLAAAIFRAVEVRTPVVVAANTGISAAIDGSGRLLARGPRRATATLRVDLWRDGRWSPWLAAGTIPTGLTLAVVAVLALEGLVASRLALRPTVGRQY